MMIPYYKESKHLSVEPVFSSFDRPTYFEYSTESRCGSVDTTMDSQSWGPRFKSAGSSSSALGQGTLSPLPSLSERT